MRKLKCASWHLWTWKGANCWFKNSSKKESEPAVAILAPLKTEGSFFTSALVPDTACSGPGDAGTTQKGQILPLAPAQNGKSKGRGVDVGSQPSDTWHSFWR